MTRKRRTDGSSATAVHAPPALSADEAAATAIHDLRQLFDEAFYTELKTKLESMGVELQGVSSRIGKVETCTKNIVTEQADLRESLEAASDALEQHARSVEQNLKASEQALTKSTQIEIHGVKVSLAALLQRVVAIEHVLEDSRAAAGRTSERIEQQLRSLAELNEDQDRRMLKQVEQLDKDLHDAATTHQEETARLTVQLATVEKRLLCMASELERSTALNVQLEQSSTALTSYARSQLTTLETKLRVSTVFTIIGWLLPTILLWIAWRLGR